METQPTKKHQETKAGFWTLSESCRLMNKATHHMENSTDDMTQSKRNSFTAPSLPTPPRRFSTRASRLHEFLAGVGDGL